MANGTFILEAESVYDADISPQAAIDRSKMAQRTNAVFAIPHTEWRVWDALATVLPGTPASDDLGMVTGATYGTNPPYIGTGDLKAAGSTTRRMRALIPVPHDFEGNSATITVRLYAGMITTIADVAATVDVEAYRIDKDGTYGASDVVSTAATTINSLTAAAKDFVLTTSTLSAGDILDIRVSVLVNDAATVTAVIGAIWQAELLVDLR